MEGSTNGMRHRRPIFMGLALALVAGLLAVPAAPAAAHCGGTSTYSFITFHMEWEATKKRYRIGETARININITRPAEEDPLGEGVPMERPIVEAAEDVYVGVGVVIGDVFTHGFGRTDQNGDAVVRIRVPRWTKPGTANVRALAQNLVADVAGCFWVYEYGFKSEKSFFRVTR